MTNFKKQFLLIFFIFAAGLFVIGSASAQTWYSVYPVQNPCSPTTVSESIGAPGRCMCNSGYSWGRATAGNCTYNGLVIGCWNPGSGKCQECGTGGTIILGSNACFNNGQYNQGESQPVGISCTIQGGVGTAYPSSSQCVSSGTSSGGFSTN